MQTLLHHLLIDTAHRSPASKALYYKDQSLSYQQLSMQVRAYANFFLQLELQRYDRIAVYLPKRFETVISFFAASAAGMTFVPVNPILKADQVDYILKDCNVRLLITSYTRLQQLQHILTNCNDLLYIIVIDIPAEASALDFSHLRVISSAQINAIDTDRPPCISSIDTDMTAILYTSGSTGNPKGVILSHRNLIAGAQSVSQYLENNHQDILLAVLPFSFDYGLSQLTTAFSVGASVVLMDYLFPVDVVRAVGRYKITGLAAVPPLWIQLAQLTWPDEAKESLRYITNSGGTMPVETLNLLRSALPRTKPFLMYGLTEAFRSTYVPPENLDRHMAAIGIAIPNAEVLVLREDGSECDINEPGELVHRGSLVALGYWNAPEKTNRHFKPARPHAPGLMKNELAVWSGDTVRRDKEGYLYFIGRQDNMIKTSGYRVSPDEIEKVAYTSGMVSDAIALGVPHPVIGQAIVLIIKSTSDTFEATKLMDYCKKVLPNFMHPAKIISISRLPHNQNGKIDRTLLFHQYSTLFTATANEA